MTRKCGDAYHLILLADRDMRQKASLCAQITHSTDLKQRTTQADLDEIEDRTDRAARRIYQDASWGLATLIFQS